MVKKPIQIHKKIGNIVKIVCLFVCLGIIQRFGVAFTDIPSTCFALLIANVAWSAGFEIICLYLLTNNTHNRYFSSLHEVSFLSWH